MNKITFPDKFLPFKKLIKKDELKAPLKRDAKDTSLKILDIEAAGAEEYAVYGWAKWANIPDKQTWHNVFRLTDFKGATEANADKTGDRTLCMWVGNGFFHFTTYTYGYKAGDNVNVVHNIAYEDDLE